MFALPQLTGPGRPVLLLLFTLCQGWLLAQQPHACDGSFYLTRVGSGENSTQLLRIPPGEFQNTSAWELLTTFVDRKIGPVGFRVVDNLIYALDTENLDLLTIDANGAVSLRGNLKSRLDTTLEYHAGAITPFGKYFILIGRDPFTGYDQDLFRVRLDRQDLTTGITALLPPTEIQLGDIAYSPVYGNLVGFDALNRTLVDIRQFSGLVSDFSFQVQGQIGRLEGMFFDREGHLYGYGNSGGNQDNFFYQLNELNGVAQEIGGTLISETSDACGCPYTVPFSKKYTPNPALDCDDVKLVYNWTSFTGTTFRDVAIRDTLPPGIKIEELLYSPQPASIETPLGSNEVYIQFQDLLLGEDSVVFRISVDETQPTQPASTGFMGPLPLAYNVHIPTRWDDSESGLIAAPLEVEIQSTRTSLCEGNSIELNASVSVPLDRASFMWSTGAMTSTIEVREGGTYFVDITADCETASDSIVIQSLGRGIDLDLGPDREIWQGEVVELGLATNAIPPYQIRWYNSNGTEMSCLACENPETSPLETTRYYLALEDATGCTALDSVTILVSTNRGIQIPNVFSPNLDGINDQFFVSGNGTAIVTDMQIWDRFGRKVFQEQGGAINDMSRGWDGEWQGKPVTAGVYFYAVKLTFPDQEIRQYEGSITLLR